MTMALPPVVADFKASDFLLGHIRHTLAFYEGAKNGTGAGALDPSGGFFHFFADDGTVYDRRTRHLVSSTRFVFNHATAYRGFGRAYDRDAARHALRFVTTAHAQPSGGFAWQLDWDGQRATVQDATNHCYGLAFVLLAHAHAAMAGIDEACAGIDATATLMERRFWDAAHGLYADEATPDWQVGGYRGQNANMHACEAMLAAHQATGEARFLERALTLAESVTQRLAAQSTSAFAATPAAAAAAASSRPASVGIGEGRGLVWEHYRQDWRIDPDYNRHDKTNIFRPWGFQTGHLTEWAKLLLQLEARLPSGQRPAWAWPTAKHFFDTAMARGWDEVHGGLVYGFGPDGAVCDADKYFWVQAESFAAAAWIARRAIDSGEDGVADNALAWYDRIWAYAWAHMVDHEHGAWWRIRTPDNRAYDQHKSPAGKTDYHTMGACWDVLAALATPTR
jgi:mannose/cellobiose epimerase-like protein (N-acyl-D-glucosamine 2-epimerase family)